MITVADLQAIAGTRTRSPMLVKIADAFNKHASNYGVTHQKDIADCLAHICVETGGFRRLSENLNYSASALKKLFGRHRISLADCEKYGRKNGQKANLTALANILYGGKFGEVNLGNTKPGDGWKFRGSGPGQATGRANFKRAEDLTGVPFTSNPELMRDPDKGMEATLALWSCWNMNRFNGGSKASRRKWNGGLHGFSEYAAAYQRAMLRRLEVPSISLVEVVEPDLRDEILQDVAAEGRLSTTQIASAGGGVVAVGTVLNDLNEHATHAKSIFDAFGSVDWKTAVIMILIAILAYIWWRRRGKQIAARNALS